MKADQFPKASFEEINIDDILFVFDGRKLRTEMRVIDKTLWAMVLQHGDDENDQDYISHNEDRLYFIAR